MTSTSVKTILLVGNWPSDTGYAWKLIERFWIAIARSFPERRTFVCFPEVRAANPELTAAGINVLQFSFDFTDPHALVQFCRKHNVGLIYLTDRPYTSPVYPKLRASGVQRIVVHDHAPGQRTRPSAVKSLSKKINARFYGADAYVACSDQVLDRLTNVGCLPPKRCHLARNGIDVTQFPHPNPTIRQELELPSDALLAVSCSRLHPYKRVADIVEAAAQLPDLPIHFIHVGDGPALADIRARIRDRGLGPRFTLLGHRNDVPQILSGCDIAVHASNGEGLSLALLEFMASGLPIAVTDEPTVSGIVKPGVTGLTFTHGNATALAQTLRTLATNRALRHRLGEAARTVVESQYRIEDTVSSVVNVIRSTLMT